LLWPNRGDQITLPPFKAKKNVVANRANWANVAPCGSCLAGSTLLNAARISPEMMRLEAEEVEEPGKATSEPGKIPCALLSIGACRPGGDREARTVSKKTAGQDQAQACQGRGAHPVGSGVGRICIWARMAFHRRTGPRELRPVAVQISTTKPRFVATSPHRACRALLIISPAGLGRRARPSAAQLPGRWRPWDASAGRNTHPAIPR